MVFYGRISSFFAVIDPNSFGLVSIIGTRQESVTEEKGRSFCFFTSK